MGGTYAGDTIKLFFVPVVQNPEFAIETVLQEFGHALSDHAGRGQAWASRRDWLLAAGWPLNPTPDREPSVKFQYAISVYAYDSPHEDFAETFLWYIEDRSGNRINWYRQGRNPLNQAGIPNPEREDEIIAAIAQLP